MSRLATARLSRGESCLPFPADGACVKPGAHLHEEFPSPFERLTPDDCRATGGDHDHEEFERQQRFLAQARRRPQLAPRPSPAPHDTRKPGGAHGSHTPVRTSANPSPWARPEFPASWGTRPVAEGCPPLRVDSEGLWHPVVANVPGVYALRPGAAFTRESVDLSTREAAGLAGEFLGGGDADIENPLVRGVAGLAPRDPLNPRVGTAPDGTPVVMHLEPRSAAQRYAAVRSNPRIQAAGAEIRRELCCGTAYAPSQEGFESVRSWATLMLAPLAEDCGRSLGLAQGYADNRTTETFGYAQGDERALSEATDRDEDAGLADGVQLACGLAPAASTWQDVQRAVTGGAVRRVVLDPSARGRAVEAVRDVTGRAVRRTESAWKGLHHVDRRMLELDVRTSNVASDELRLPVPPGDPGRLERRITVRDGAYVAPRADRVRRISAEEGLTEQGRICVPGGTHAPHGSALMYVVDEDGGITMARRGRIRISHAGLVGGRDPRVRAAGMVTFDGKGRILRIDNASGHFKPGARSLLWARQAFQKLPQSVWSPAFEGYVDHTGRKVIGP